METTIVIILCIILMITLVVSLFITSYCQYQSVKGELSVLRKYYEENEANRPGIREFEYNGEWFVELDNHNIVPSDDVKYFLVPYREEKKEVIL